MKWQGTAFPFYRQLDSMDCAPACLRMLAAYHGRDYSMAYLRELCWVDREGVSVASLKSVAEQIGFDSLALQLPFASSDDRPDLSSVPLPAIVHWEQRHYVVVYRISAKYVWIADPGRGKLRLSVADFCAQWLPGQEEGVALVFSPREEFHALAEPEAQAAAEDVSSWKSWIRPYRRLLGQLLIGLVLSAVFALVFPFMTQAIVDIGIQNADLNFIYLILLGQLFLFFSQTAVYFLQSWILLHLGIRLNVGLISNFLDRMMRLPMGYFDRKKTGDLLQRIGDHHRVGQFLTQSSLAIILAVLNVLVFSVVLLLYSPLIFFIFMGAAILYLLWVFWFLGKRRIIDEEAFGVAAENQDALLEIIQGMSEIKLQNSQRQRRAGWAGIQTRLFKVQMRALRLAQYQESGALFINQLKDILITVVAATAVISGQLTLGMMLAIQYIIGQLNAPLQQLVGFVRAAQDARLSWERLREVHRQPVEADSGHLTYIPKGDLTFREVAFRYHPEQDWVLQDIDLCIPRGQVTAIVGRSGSGKTSLLKLLLRFYAPTKGHIYLGEQALTNVRQASWRAACGAVLQDGYLFTDTIANNICEGSVSVDQHRLGIAIAQAGLQAFVQELPLGLQTMIGPNGQGISQGQRQRILIARALYKNPDILLLDEATNALDAATERLVQDNLQAFFAQRTVVVVAHRLSTVKHADQIVVLEKGKIVERGTHSSLLAEKGVYYALVKEQLEV